ncbi:methyl-accepting chemotaxis protein [Desulfonema ishimotonii]|uniref:Methyl-accepting chemotaxis protein n=1 Tax=Desulfonema ishimotonii TaxID=45657 RepID=A0A401FTJ5_9BACT|nr:methyl-accepting chemotaxis protein [Desulfonema ishimotonii]GBC60286.1 methyl-accepting chemotaxis protein [Desulfonema ishimotonii]
MKRFKLSLGVKIGSGYAVLILILIILGGISAWNIQKVRKQSTLLGKEYVHEVRLAHHITRDAQETVSEIHRYIANNGDRNFLEKALNSLSFLKNDIAEAKALAADATHLSVLGTAVKNIEPDVSEYEKYLDEIARKYDEIADLRQTLDQAAQAFTDNCNQLMTYQRESAETEILADFPPERQYERLKKIALIDDLTNLAHTTQNGILKALVRRNPALLRDAWKNFGAIENKYREILELINMAENIEKVKTSQSANLAYKNAMKNYLDNWTAIQKQENELKTLTDRILNNAMTAGQNGIAETEEIAARTVSSIDLTSKVNMTGIIGALVLALIISTFITRSITRSVLRMIGHINRGSEQVAAASGQLRSASNSLARGASEQAAAAEETASSMEQMASVTLQNADNARMADTLMNEAVTVVKTANRSMDELTGSMTEIIRASQETGAIIKTIDEIAFQTNLLALNAAVEAARAGEAGAGFAVVASEVKNLATRSAEAARNTAGLIEETLEKIQKGSDVVTNANDAFSEVYQISTKAGELVSEIAAASDDQTRGIDQVKKGIEEMDLVIQQNAANAEETSSAASQMHAQARQMKAVVRELVVLVTGNSSDLTVQGENIVAHTASEEYAPALPDETDMPEPETRNHQQARLPRKEISPEEVIPFDEDDFRDFKDF